MDPVRAVLLGCRGLHKSAFNTVRPCETPTRDRCAGDRADPSDGGAGDGVRTPTTRGHRDGSDLPPRGKRAAMTDEAGDSADFAGDDPGGSAGLAGDDAGDSTGPAGDDPGGSAGLTPLVADLRAAALDANQRRLLVLAGDPDAGRAPAAAALAAADVPAAGTTVLTPADDAFGRQAHDAGLNAGALDLRPPGRSATLLGTTRAAVVLDCHHACEPNALGRAAGAVDGGGLLVLLTPPLDDWPTRRDAFDATLAVPPCTVEDVAGRFRRRLVDTLETHPGVAVYDVDAERVVRDGAYEDPLTPARSGPGGSSSHRGSSHRGSSRRGSPPSAPRNHAFPAAAYEACLTVDQSRALRAFEALRDPGRAVVVEADRGRGKSSAAGLAAGALAAEGRDVLVTAPEYRNAAEVFARAAEVLTAMGALASDGESETPRRLDAESGGSIEFERPPAAADRVAGAAAADGSNPDAVIVDEAAALPVRVLERFLDAPAVAFTTTVHGYEGAGRGFSVRFRDRLDDSALEVTEIGMTDPIRYAAGDPVESWAFRALGLDASPAVDPVVADATPDSVEYRALSPADLLDDEHLLRETFGLLVAAHYRTEPDDLARLLDAPNVTVRALLFDGHVVSVALLAREGALPADVRAHSYEGGRIRGNMIPDVLTCQLRDEAAGVPVGYRVMRIATHHAVRSRGLGSRLLSEVRAEVGDEVDWIGTGYGATPELLAFWRSNGFSTLHLSTTRNDASGEYSAVMLAPTSDAGEELARRHAEWFAERIEGVLSDPLDDVDADVVRETLRSVDAAPPVDLSDWEWRLLAGLPGGASIFDTAPRPLRLLAARYLIDHGGDGAGDGRDGAGDSGTVDDGPRALTDRQERLLVRKALQGESWQSVADALEYPSRAEAMRALGRTVPPLVSRYGDAKARSELERFE